MKVLIYVLVLAGAMLSATAFAQETAASKESGNAGPKRGRLVNADDHLIRLSRVLNLTADQQAQLKPILQSHFEEQKKVRGDGSISMTEKLSKTQEIQDRTDKRIVEILTPDQRNSYEQICKRRDERGPKADRLSGK